MSRAGNIIDGVRVRVMVSVIRNPRIRGSGTIEHREEYQQLLRNRIELHSPMRERPMIPNSGSQSSESRSNQGREKHFPAGQRKKNESNACKDVNQNEVNEDVTILTVYFPPGLSPRVLLRQRSIYQ
jgi:hypothetical protein